MEDPGHLKSLDIPYIKILRLCLLPVAVWPNLNNEKATLFDINALYMLIQLIVVIGEIIYLINIFGVVDFFLVGDVYITTFLTMLSLVRLSLPKFKRYHNLLRNFLAEFHLINFQHKGGAFKKVHSAVHKVSLYITVFTTGLLLSGFMLFNLSPMYINVTNGAFTFNRHNLRNLTLEFSVRYKYPGFDQTDNFLFTTVINFYLSFLCSLSIIPIDLLLILMIFQIIGHLEILAMNMKSIPKPKTVYFLEEINNVSTKDFYMEIFDIEQNFMIKQKLRELINHHNLIIRFTDDLSAFFGPMLGFTYLFHLVSCCLLLLECSRGDPDVIVRYGPLTSLIFLQLIQISITFEVMSHKSSVLIDSVYELPWQSMNIENQRIVCIVLRRVQEHIQVSAFGLVDVGVKTMANILKTTFSYYTFLKSL